MSHKPYMPLYISDYMADTSHLTTVEHGAYLLLLMTYWQTEKPLPNDIKSLASICKMQPVNFKKIWSRLFFFFEVKNHHVTHKRLEKELKKYRENVDMKRLAANKRWENSRQKDMQMHMHVHSKRNADAMQTQCYTDTDTDNYSVAEVIVNTTHVKAPARSYSSSSKSVKKIEPDGGIAATSAQQDDFFIFSKNEQGSDIGKDFGTPMDNHCQDVESATGEKLPTKSDGNLSYRQKITDYFLKEFPTFFTDINHMMAFWAGKKARAMLVSWKNEGVILPDIDAAVAEAREKGRHVDNPIYYGAAAIDFARERQKFGSYKFRAQGSHLTLKEDDAENERAVQRAIKRMAEREKEKQW